MFTKQFSSIEVAAAELLSLGADERVALDYFPSGSVAEAAGRLTATFGSGEARIYDGNTQVGTVRGDPR